MNYKERLKTIINSDNTPFADINIFLKYFPEFKESKGERIRKALIALLKSDFETDTTVHDISVGEIIAWLEKRGEPTDKIVKKAMIEKQRVLLTETNGDANIDWDTRSLQDVKLLLEQGLEYIKKLEKQGEQKSVNKVESKFKVGYWVVLNENHNSIYQVEKIESYHYVLRHILGGIFRIPFDSENSMRLWTLQDAKPRDVLAFDDNNMVMFKNLYNETTFHSYCHIEDGLFKVNRDEMPDWWEGKGFHPATKEQRDILFAKMREAGYEWDEDKKLKKS